MSDETQLTPAELERQLEADIAAFELDPLGYVKYAFPWGEPGTELEAIAGPRQWQVDVLTEIGDRLRAGLALADAVAQPVQLARCSGHGIGKSALIAWLTKWALDTREDTKVLITANTEKQLLTKTSPELAKWNRLSITAHWFHYATTSLKSTDPEHEATWRADLVSWSEHNTEAFAGLHNVGKRIVVLFDEASAIADKVWEVTEGALTDALTQIVWVVFGNGTRSTGRFRECFRRLRHRWLGAQIDSRTVEGVNTVQANKWVEDYGEDSDFVKIRVRGMFPSASPKQFISETDVDAAYGRKIRLEQFAFAPKILTVDPAWTGVDEMVIGLRQGLVFRILKTIPKNDDDVAMANLIARLEDDEQADAVFIDGGYGTGIVSVGRTLGRDWLIVWFGAKLPEGSAALNKRAAMAIDAKRWLKEGGCIEADPILHQQLTSIETVPRLDDRIQLMSKEDMRAIGLDSPGRADALFLSFAYPVTKKAYARPRAGSGRPGHQSIAEYDPLAPAANDPFLEGAFR